MDLGATHLLFAKPAYEILFREAESPESPEESGISSDTAPFSPIPVRSSEGGVDQDATHGDSSNIEDVVFLRDESMIPEDVASHLSNRYPGYDYAALHWDHHYAQAESLAGDSVQQDAVNPLSCVTPKLGRWYKYRAGHSTTAMLVHLKSVLWF